MLVLSRLILYFYFLCSVLSTLSLHIMKCSMCNICVRVCVCHCHRSTSSSLIMDAKLLMGRTSICSPDSLGSGWHGFHRMLEMCFCDCASSEMITICRFFIWTLLLRVYCCTASRPKGFLLDSQLVIGEYTELIVVLTKPLQMTFVSLNSAASCRKYPFSFH